MPRLRSLAGFNPAHLGAIIRGVLPGGVATMADLTPIEEPRRFVADYEKELELHPAWKVPQAVSDRLAEHQKTIAEADKIQIQSDAVIAAGGALGYW